MQTTNGVTVTLGNLTPTGALAVIEAYKDAEKTATNVGAEYRETAGTTATTIKGKKTGKKTPPPPADDEELIDDGDPGEDMEMASTDDEETIEDEESFDAEEEVEEEEAPAKKAKAATKTDKPAKLTEKDVNRAAMAYAKVKGRPAVLKILEKQFKVKSILELKADQYPAVMKALKL